jgi:predicted extracellular nuclease
MLDEGPINTSTTTNFGYRIEPTTAPTFGPGNDRTSAPGPVGGNLQVGFFNVLNYFTTLNPTNDQSAGSTPGRELGGRVHPAEDEDRCRHVEAGRRRGRPQRDREPGRNQRGAGPRRRPQLLHRVGGRAATTYAAVPDPTTVPAATRSSREIYKPAVVEPVGASISDPAAINNRPPLAQEFRLLANGETVNVVVNHLKSKGSCPADSDLGNRDNGDGQGCWNAQRVAQADQLLDFIDTVKSRSGDNDVLAIGDFNSYGHDGTRSRP